MDENKCHTQSLADRVAQSVAAQFAQYYSQSVFKMDENKTYICESTGLEFEITYSNDDLIPVVNEMFGLKYYIKQNIMAEINNSQPPGISGLSIDTDSFSLNVISNSGNIYGIGTYMNSLRDKYEVRMWCFKKELKELYSSMRKNEIEQKNKTNDLIKMIAEYDKQKIDVKDTMEFLISQTELVQRDDEIAKLNKRVDDLENVLNMFALNMKRIEEKIKP